METQNRYLIVNFKNSSTQLTLEDKYRSVFGINPKKLSKYSLTIVFVLMFTFGKKILNKSTNIIVLL